MNRFFAPAEFDALKAAALADCEAHDTFDALVGADIATDTIAAAVIFERSKRLKRYEGAIYSALEARVSELRPQKAKIDKALELAEHMLSKSFDSQAETDDETQRELTDDLRQRLAIGTIDYDTFVEAAVAMGYSESMGSRTFYKHQASQREFWPCIDLDLIFNELMRDLNRDGSHPMVERIHGFGPQMLDITFAVCDAYLTSMERKEESATGDGTPSQASDEPSIS